MTGKRIFTVESLSGAILTLWGISIADPSTDSFSKAPQLYAPMTAFVPSEAFWGVLYALFGLNALLLCFLEAQNIRKWWIPSSSLFNTIIYLSITALFFIGDATTTNWRLWSLIIIWNFIHWRWSY